jgi:hypothetical protein
VAAGDEEAARTAAGDYLSATERIMLEGLARSGGRRESDL